MKYLCLVYVDAAAVAALSPEQNQKLIDNSMDFDAEVERRGQLIMAQPLHEPETAITIRMRNGKMSSTDGPFAETKEHLGGFFLIDAATSTRPSQIAAEQPDGRGRAASR